eukprot:m.102832 g.102832  ORF g.102832 m.102832 type:complete len:835 (-) comp10450_c0_seq2:456-2960(-)
MDKQMAKKQREAEKARAKAEKEAAKAAKKAAKAKSKGGGDAALPPSQMAIPRSQTISLQELSQLGPEDRIAAMNLVKEGEMTPEEAIIRVKAEAKEKELAKQGVRSKGIGRRGGMKKANRGRLNLELMVIGPDKEYSVVLLKLNKVYDLDCLEADPYLQVYLSPDPNNPKKPDMKETAVHKKTRNPIFDEQFQWSVRSKLIDLEQVRLHIVCYDKQSGVLIKRNNFMGSMSFCLAEIWDPESSTEGWFKFLDEKRGSFQNQKFVPKYKHVPPGAVNVPTTASTANDPLPPPPQSLPHHPLPADVPVPARAPPPPVAPKPRKSAPPPVVAKRNAAPPTTTASKPAPLLRVSADDFIFTKVLGRGSFGKVFLAEKRGCDDVFAIKCLKKTSVVEDDDVAGTMTEKRVLALSGGSPFLTRLHATFQTDAQLYFVMEFVNGGDLMYHIQQLRIFSLEQSRFYAAEILLGLWFMHENGILYRDLKLDNVMLDYTGHIKIADFGMCKEKMFGAATTTTFCGTPGYLAPEIINEAPYGASVDFWSLGVLCYEFLVGDSPFEADDDEELFNQILTAKVHYPPRLQPAARDFVDSLLDRNPNTRLGCGPNGKETVMKHPFFHAIDWDALARREVKPPYKPQVKNPKKAECFDDEFTQEAPQLTPIDPGLVGAIEQREFSGFSFVQRGAFGLEDAGGDVVGSTVVDKNDLTQYSWYRPNLARQDVVSLLKGRESGAFCVRDSASQPGYVTCNSATGVLPSFTISPYLCRLHLLSCFENRCASTDVKVLLDCGVRMAHQLHACSIGHAHRIHVRPLTLTLTLLPNAGAMLCLCRYPPRLTSCGRV